jgi:hypothetical protein
LPSSFIPSLLSYSVKETKDDRYSHNNMYRQDADVCALSVGSRSSINGIADACSTCSRDSDIAQL